MKVFCGTNVLVAACLETHPYHRKARPSHILSLCEITDRQDAALTVIGPCRNLCALQTTIQLDDDLLAQATKLAREKGCDLSRLIEETLRDKIATCPPVAPQTIVRLTTVAGGGVRPGVDLNNSAALLTLMEQGA
jgi:hypothetical protein